MEPPWMKPLSKLWSPVNVAASYPRFNEQA